MHHGARMAAAMPSPCCPRWPLSWGVRKAALSHALPRPAHQLWLPSWLTTQLKASNVGCTQRAATRRCTVHSQSTLQQYAAAIGPPGDSAAAPACCQSHPSAMLLCHKLLRNGTRAASTRAHMQANLPAYRQEEASAGSKRETSYHNQPSLHRQSVRDNLEPQLNTCNARNASTSLPIPFPNLLYQFNQSHGPSPNCPFSYLLPHSHDHAWSATCSTCRHSLHVPYLVLV